MAKLEKRAPNLQNSNVVVRPNGAAQCVKCGDFSNLEMRGSFLHCLTCKHAVQIVWDSKIVSDKENSR